MSRREDEAFQKWVDELSQEVQPAEAEAFKVWAKTDAAREVFRGTIGQAELYRRMNDVAREKKEIEAAREELQAWFEEEAPKNEALVKERDELRKQLAELGVGGPPPASGTPTPSVSPEELADLKAKVAKIDALDRMIPAVLGDIARVVQESQRDGYDIDPREVIKYSLQQNMEPYRAFQALTADERRKREEAKQEEERKKWFEEGRRAALSTNSPDHFKPSGPSVVDYLRELNKATGATGAAPSQADRVSAAMKEFVEGSF